MWPDVEPGGTGIDKAFVIRAPLTGNEFPSRACATLRLIRRVTAPSNC